MPHLRWTPTRPSSRRPSPLTSAASAVVLAFATACSGTSQIDTTPTDTTTQTRMAALEESENGPAWLLPDEALFGVDDFHVAQGFVLFAGDDGVHGRELWRGDGVSEHTVLLGDLNDGPGSSEPGDFVTVDPLTFFSAYQPETGRELWVTNGGVSGTHVIDLLPGPEESRAAPVARVGDRVLVRAWTPETGFEPWISDGTEEGTVPLGDLLPDEDSGFEMAEAGSAGSLAYFAGTDAQHGRELWVTDGTPEGTGLVADLDTGAWDSDPRDFFGLPDGRVVFTAFDDGRVCTSDGTEAGTHCFGTEAGVEAGSFTRVGDDVYYLADRDSEPGRTLRRLDVATLGTSEELFADVASQVVDLVATPSRLYFVDAPSQVTLWALEHGSDVPVAAVTLEDFGGGSLVPVGDAVVFTGVDTEHGAEPWKSGGTPETTSLLADLADGPDGSNPARFVFVRDTVIFTADADVQTGVPAVIPAQLIDTPPVVTCPTDPVELIGDVPAGATVDGRLTVTIADAESPGLTAVFTPAVAPWGHRTITARVHDAIGNEATCTLPVEVTHPDPLTLVCPEDRFLEAGWGQSATTTFEAQASHPLAEVEVSYSHASGSEFAFGTTPVTITATGAGQVASCTFHVTVRDSTPPVVICPESVVVEATSPSGAQTELPAPIVDEEDDVVTVLWSQHPDSLFPLGDTEITAVVEDRAGNTTSCTFLVIVRDTTPPELTCPADVEVTQSGPDGATISAGYTAVDTASTVSVVSEPDLAGTFPVGETTVQLIATDEYENKTFCSFTVRVKASSTDDPDTDPDPDPEPDEDGVCGGCSGTGAVVEWALLLPLLALALRRRSLPQAG